MAESDSQSEIESEFDGFEEGEIGEERLQQFVGLDSDSDDSLSEWDVDSSDISDEENDGLMAENARLDWREQTHEVHVEEFANEHRTGPNVNLPADASVLDYFLLLFPLRNFRLIARQTNLYAAQQIAASGVPDSKWYPTDEDGREIRAYFGMNILMGLHDVPAYEWFWSEDNRINCAGISSVMPKARYEKLTQYIHLVDNSEALPRDHPDFDPLFKVRPLLDSTVNRFYRHYYPRKELSVDEAMIGFKGRVSMKSYMPCKPTKWGIKVWMCCDATTGYTNSFQIYSGKERNVTEHGLAHRVVLDLVRPFLGLGHHIYYDNFFASVGLQQELLENKTYACSTVRVNRKGLPADAKQVKLRRHGDLLVRQAGNHVLTMWFDKRQVAVLSSNTTPGTETIQRHNTQIRKPTAIVKYNKFMGGVDLADQLRSYYDVGREAKKWWKYVMWFVVNICLVNSYILYNENVPGERKRKKEYTAVDFRLDLEAQLRAGFTCRKNRIGRLPRAKRTLANIIDKENVGPHECVKIPVSVSKRQKLTCRQCKLFQRTTVNGGPKETTFFCTVCKVPLCKVGCHRDYHNNVKP